MARKSLHVQFVNDGARGVIAQWGVAFPVIGAGIHDHTLHRGSTVSVLGAGRLAVVVFWNDDTGHKDRAMP